MQGFETRNDTIGPALGFWLLHWEWTTKTSVKAGRPLGTVSPQSTELVAAQTPVLVVSVRATGFLGMLVV